MSIERPYQSIRNTPKKAGDIDLSQPLIPQGASHIPPLMNMIPFWRYSCDRQADGWSEERQELSSHKTAERFKWVYRGDLLFFDDGVSAYQLTKEGVPHNFSPEAATARLIHAAETGLLPPNSVVEIEDPSRFSRASIDTADAQFWRLPKAGVHVYICSNNMFIRPGDENVLLTRIILLLEWDKAHAERIKYA
jgi:hypothetical protein